MDLRSITTEPKLIKITIALDETDKDAINENMRIVAEYEGKNHEPYVFAENEGLDFYTWDRQPLDVFLKFSTLDRGDFASVVMLLKDLIFYEDGSKVLVDGVMMPPTVLVKVVTKMIETLGK